MKEKKSSEEKTDVLEPADKQGDTQDKKQGKKPSVFQKFSRWLEWDLPRPLRTAPHMGMRMVKTGVAVLAVFFFYLFVKRPENGLFMAMIATIVSMQDTVNKSLRIGVIRVIATGMGGLIGLAFVWGANTLGLAESSAVTAILNSLGVMLCIWVCVWWGVQEGAVISCVVFQAIFLNAGVESPYLYALNRMLDTAIGIVFSVIVNLSIRRPKAKDGTRPPEP